MTITKQSGNTTMLLPQTPQFYLHQAAQTQAVQHWDEQSVIPWYCGVFFPSRKAGENKQCPLGGPQQLLEPRESWLRMYGIHTFLPFSFAQHQLHVYVFRRETWAGRSISLAKINSLSLNQKRIIKKINRNKKENKQEKWGQPLL